MGDETPVRLGDFSEFVRSEIEAGRYASASDVVQAALGLLEAERHQRNALLAAIREGEESGPAEPFDFNEFIAARKSKSV